MLNLFALFALLAPVLLVAAAQDGHTITIGSRTTVISLPSFPSSQSQSQSGTRIPITLDGVTTTVDLPYFRAATPTGDSSSASASAGSTQSASSSASESVVTSYALDISSTTSTFTTGPNAPTFAPNATRSNATNATTGTSSPPPAYTAGASILTSVGGLGAGVIMMVAALAFL